QRAGVRRQLRRGGHRRRGARRAAAAARRAAGVRDHRWRGRHALRERALAARAARHGHVPRWHHAGGPRCAGRASLPRGADRRRRDCDAPGARARRGVDASMFLLENFIQAIAFTLDSLLSIYFWIVLISALLSWVNPDPRNPTVRFLYSVNEPVHTHIRHLLPYLVSGGPVTSPDGLMYGSQFGN